MTGTQRVDLPAFSYGMIAMARRPASRRLPSWPPHRSLAYAIIALVVLVLGFLGVTLAPELAGLLPPELRRRVTATTAVPTAARRPPPAATDTDLATLPGTATPFEEAKKLLYGTSYRDHRQTFYGGCDYDERRQVDLVSGDLEALADKARAQRLEAEPIFPAAQFGNFRACWRSPRDFPDCVKSDGKTLSGRQCCQQVDPVFNAAHNDLQNLVPAVGEINGQRRDYHWGMIPGEKRVYGACNVEVDASLRRVEPPQAAAQYQLALRYVTGRGLPVEVPNALHWMEKAAQPEYTPAQ